MCGQHAQADMRVFGGNQCANWDEVLFVRSPGRVYKTYNGAEMSSQVRLQKESASGEVIL